VLLVLHSRHHPLLRIGMLIAGAALLFGITSAQGLIDFYDNATDRSPRCRCRPR